MIDIKELKEQKIKNFEERLKFIDLWCDYIKKPQIKFGVLNKQK
ncbi:MAG: hypothetical protein QXM38_01530 [Candidatus Aenigmatarchaeota archaeon]